MEQGGFSLRPIRKERNLNFQSNLRLVAGAIGHEGY